MGERLQKLMSQWGVASRRKAEQMILDRRVRLNGAIAELGQKADPDSDRVELDGKLISPQTSVEKRYILLHKPVGVISTCSDPWNRSTVMELLPSTMVQGTGLHPVGRLDINSTGALLLTNHGALTFGLTHPRHTIPKCYHVWIHGVPSYDTLQQWQQGVMLSGRLTLPADVQLLHSLGEKSLLEIVLREGRNRQIRRVADILGHPVIRLHRISIGSIHLGDLPVGQFRTLSSSEIKFLLRQAQTFALSDQKSFNYDSVHLRGQG
ncbi:MAG: pseudouridine synthase [Leptolyngbyaceae bacterium]|nr:pseudouridine synthase [Leptolyngbyaceae bacterium]